MNRWALIPIKGFDRGKSRLADVLEPEERAQLTRELFDHVVDVLKRSNSVDHIAVVSDSDEARRHAEARGLLALSDVETRRGLSDVVNAAVQHLEARGATSVLICMSDLPELCVDDIDSVTRALEESDVVLVPDLLQRGTNVIALRPPSALPSCLGHDDSLRRHRELARDIGLTVTVPLRAGMSFDVDHPGDLARLRRAQ